MNVLSLFAGIGGLDLGCEAVGWRTEVYSEFDPKIASKRNGFQYAAAVMAKHFPDAINVGDISQLAFATNTAGEHGILQLESMDVDTPLGTYVEPVYIPLWKGHIDIIVGGFPCQDISLAGKQAGMEEGTRSGLWRHFFQAIKGLRPKGVIIENVAALAGKGLDRVLRDLASIGYDAERDIIAAAGVGAPHLRERMFIIAWPAGTAHHDEWPEPPVFDHWIEEPHGVPRLVGDVANRPARLRCLGNAVVPQVAAHVAKILSHRLLTGLASPHIQVKLHEARGCADARHRSGDLKGQPKVIGFAAAELVGVSCQEGIETIAGKKLPRAGRMTRNKWGDSICFERNRSCTQAHAKRVGLAYMAPTLRPRADGADGLYPTPVSNDDNKSPEAHLAMKSRMGGGRKQITSLQVLSKVDGFDRLIPTPTAKDADSSRNESAIRSEGAEFKPGRTMTDFVDPTNGGRLLPTPTVSDAKGAGPLDRRPVGDDNLATRAERMEQRLLPTPTASMLTEQDMVQAAFRGNDPARPAYEDATLDKLLPTPAAADGDRASDTYMRGNATLQGAARLLPTPSANDPDGSRTLPPGTSPTGIAPDGTKYQVGLENAAKLLPTPRPCSGLRSSGLNRTEIMDALDETEGARLLPTPTTSEGGACYDAEGRQGSGNLTGAAKLLPTPVSGDHRSGMAERYGPGERRANLNDATVRMERSEGGRLGPEWVEWVQGFETGYTEL